MMTATAKVTKSNDDGDSNSEMDQEDDSDNAAGSPFVCDARVTG